MKVLSLSEYFSGSGLEGDYFTSYKIVKAIKGESFNGYGTIVVDGVRRTLNQQNAHYAAEWVAERFTDQLIADGPTDLVTLVPIPSSTAISCADVRSSNLYDLAMKVCGRLIRRKRQANVGALLHWNTRHPSAHAAGGSRNPNVLKERLVYAPHNGVGQVILIDDVVTSGGHLKAAYDKLIDSSVSTYDVAHVVARTVYTKTEALKVAVENCPRSMPTSEFLDELPF